LDTDVSGEGVVCMFYGINYVTPKYYIENPAFVVVVECDESCDAL